MMKPLAAGVGQTQGSQCTFAMSDQNSILDLIAFQNRCQPAGLFAQAHEDMPRRNDQHREASPMQP